MKTQSRKDAKPRRIKPSSTTLAERPSERPPPVAQRERRSNLKAQDRSANGSSVQRHCSAIDDSSTQKSPAKTLLLAVTAAKPRHSEM